MAGPCITNVFATRRKKFSQWYRSFQRKLLSHWLKLLRHVAITLVIQGPGLARSYFSFKLNALTIHEVKMCRAQFASQVRTGRSYLKYYHFAVRCATAIRSLDVLFPCITLSSMSNIKGTIQIHLDFFQQRYIHDFDIYCTLIILNYSFKQNVYKYLFP